MNRTISRILTATLSIAALVATVAPATTHHDSRMSLAGLKGGSGTARHSAEESAAPAPTGSHRVILALGKGAAPKGA